MSSHQLTESEFKALMPEELEFLQLASSGGNSVSLAEVNYEMLRSLYRRGLLYLRIPIREDDKFTIPPLEVRHFRQLRSDLCDGFYRRALSRIVMFLRRVPEWILWRRFCTQCSLPTVRT